MLLSFLSFLSLHSRPDKVAERTAELGRAGHHPCLSPAIHRIHRIDLLRPASQSHGLGRRSGELQHAGAHRAVSKGARPRHGEPAWLWHWAGQRHRSEEHTSELQSLMRISYDVFCLNKKKT